MDEEVKTTAALYRAAAWAHARRKQLMWTTIAVVVIGLTAAIYIWQKNQNEITAAQAYSQLKSPLGLETLPATAADPYIHLANDYSGTQAAARSLLVAGSILFDSGKFKESQTQFERLIREYPDFPLADQAAVGIAACLEAQGKTSEAASRYEEILKRSPYGPLMPQARSSLARLYVALNKPELALQMYTELAKANNPDSWSSEAGMQANELLQKYPNLKKAPPKPAPQVITPAPGAHPPALLTPPPK